MFTTPLRSENIPPIAAKTSGVAARERLRDQRGVEDGVEVAGAGVRREDAEPGAEDAGRHGAPAEPHAPARDRPDPEARTR